MPFNAGGVFERIYRWRDDRDASIKIRADRMDAEQDGIAGAINAILGGTQAFLAPVKAPDGTAAAPAFSFSSAADTGVYRKADGSLGFSEGGVEVPVLTTTQADELENRARHFALIAAANL